MPDIQTVQWGKIMILIGGGYCILPFIGVPILKEHVLVFQHNWMNNPWFLGSLLIGIGLIILADSANWNNKTINVIARATLAPYLFVTFEPMQDVVSAYIQQLHLPYTFVSLGIQIGICIVILVSMLLCDVIRIQIFSISVDRKAIDGSRRTGMWFDRLWEKLSHKFSVVLRMIYK